jgi:hypothetical protein
MNVWSQMTPLEKLSWKLTDALRLCVLRLGVNQSHAKAQSRQEKTGFYNLLSVSNRSVEEAGFAIRRAASSLTMQSP